MTGIPWIEESGMLGSIVGITNTHQVGLVRDALVEYAVDNGYARSWLLPVVAETYDGFLNDIDAFHVTKEHVFQAIASASGGVPAEGCVGGGTGMICHDFKGGIGTSSRLVETKSGRFTVGALVQANYGYGARADLRVDGVPVGREIGPDVTPYPGTTAGVGGSIIVVLATDAPLLPVQCQAAGQTRNSGAVQGWRVGAQRQWRHLPSVLHREPRHQHRRTAGRPDAPPGPDGPPLRCDGGGRGRVHRQRPDLRRDDDRPPRPHGARPPSR